MPKKVIVKKDPYDKTSAARQVSYLQKLTDDGGKRVVTDFSADDVKRMMELQAAHFGETNAEVIRNAIRQAHQTFIEKKKKDNKPE